MNINEHMKLGDTVSFSVYPGAILGTGFSRVKILAVLDAQTAAQFIDPPVMHNTVYPTLPEGSPNNYKWYPYLKLQHPSGNISVLGIPWIRMDTVEVYEATELKITVREVGSQDHDRILRILNANGYNNVTIEPVQGSID